MSQKPQLNAIVVVLGDVGHSPRISYHASSLAAHGLHVDLVGYTNSQPHPEIANNENIRIVSLPTPPKIFSHPKCPRPLQLILKTITLLFSLFYVLVFKTAFRSSLVLMQNPPGIPTMLICYLVSRFKSATFIIDWHNYTYTILQQTHSTGQQNSQRAPKSDKNSIIRFAHWWEGFFGSLADWNICVSNMMRNDLKTRWNINAITLYDKPTSWNTVDCSLRNDVVAQHSFYRRLFSTPSFAAFSSTLNAEKEFKESTLFTALNQNDKTIQRRDRPLLLVSSTSWTEDEDFGILLDALKEYEKTAEIQNACSDKIILPKLFVIITGKGPQRDYYMDKISHMRMKYVDVVSAWLEAIDYPRLLACADLGVSLHTSSSGLDLPMKIVDMHGLSLPVLAKKFPAIDEQINDGINGRLFDTAHQLRQILVELSTEFPSNTPLNELKKHMRSETRINWHEQWDALLWPIIETILRLPLKEQNRWERFQIGPDDIAEELNETSNCAN
ncbi:Chitobiosyldiphosphodolichol beta-mannosyltransferase [Aphelenchoides besseyi]|nr:Chitobiosyldiphosphodolichol beta-mannosyltransferase [Aphelenchoides besseyi]KAI6201842.1 Chitobiosyldiphosphodolichol beta-mannosyltransferase [Aphelenchoides besseyi]